MYYLLIKEVMSNPCLRYLLNTSILAIVLITGMLLIRPLLKRLPRVGLYFLWLAVAFRIICPVDLFSWLPKAVETKTAVWINEMSLNAMVNRIQEEELEQLGGEKNDYQLTPFDLAKVKNENIQNNQVTSDLDKQVLLRKTAIRIVERCYKIWLLGFIILAIYFLKSYVWLSLRLRDAKLVDEGVYTHPLVKNSFVLGLREPRIYISERVEWKERRYILCHERIHIRRHDYVIKPLMFLLCAVFWFNPLMWVAYHLMIKDMEISCDEAVLSQFGEHQRKYYSYLLLGLSEERIWQHQFVAFKAGMLKERICHVLKYRKPLPIKSLTMTLITLILGGAIVSIPSVSANSGFVGVKDVYVEQSYDFPQDAKLHTLSVQEGKVYTQAQSSFGQFYMKSGKHWMLVDAALSRDLKRHSQAELTQEKCYQGEYECVGVGDGFYVLQNPNEKKRCELLVINRRTRQEEYRLDFGIRENLLDKEGNVLCKFQAGVKGNKIYCVTKKGIWMNVYGSQKCWKVVDPSCDNVYLLNHTQSDFLKIVLGDRNDFYVVMRLENEKKICHYCMRKVKVKL